MCGVLKITPSGASFDRGSIRLLRKDILDGCNQGQGREKGLCSGWTAELSCWLVGLGSGGKKRSKRLSEQAKEVNISSTIEIKIALRVRMYSPASFQN
jgi:hypothetical protein